jgi:hypothetical protein
MPPPPAAVPVADTEPSVIAVDATLRPPPDLAAGEPNAPPAENVFAPSALVELAAV